MSRDSDDNLSSIHSTYTDMYQETVQRFTRSSLSPELDRYPPSRISTKSTTYTQHTVRPDRHSPFDLYLEATGRRASSDHGAVLTVDTEQFIIGQRVWVGGIRPGQIAYIGETHFAPGEWAGVVLDEPNGKNDGCVANKRYFQCEPKRGIFSRLTRLTLAPLPGAQSNSSPTSKYSPDRSRTVSPSASVRSSFLRSPSKNGLTVGDRVIVSSGFGSRAGILRYLGETQFASGNWCGVELDEATGKNDGSVDGIKYFECKPKYGVFVPIAKVSLSPSSKKAISRLSRTGSRESLTSVGTMNSVATTNTSRLRMNSQRKSPSIKPISTPKSQFSMQDLLREKQNHIEQLMIERDLDREDAQTQALHFQKNISELKTRIGDLERQLNEERNKSEDLQYSIDEVTFCGDELNAQSQVYKERINDLERRIMEMSTGANDGSEPPPPGGSRPSDLSAKIDEQINLYKTKLANTQEEIKRLQENVKQLQTENKGLQKELMENDRNVEKILIKASGIDNLQRELELLKSKYEEQRHQLNLDFMQRLEEKNFEITQLKDELIVLKNNYASLTVERTNGEEECEILRNECKRQAETVEQMKEQVAMLTSQLSVQTAESLTLDEMLRGEQSGRAAAATALQCTESDNAELKTQLETLKQEKATLEDKLVDVNHELEALITKLKAIESKLAKAESSEKRNFADLKNYNDTLGDLNKKLADVEAANELLVSQVQTLELASGDAAAEQESLRKQLGEKEALHNDSIATLKTARQLTAQLQTDMAAQQVLFEKQEIALNAKNDDLTKQIGMLQQYIKDLESNSSTAVHETSLKISQLETQNAKLHQSLCECEEWLEHEKAERQKQATALSNKTREWEVVSELLSSKNKFFDKFKEQQEHLQVKYSQLEQSEHDLDAQYRQLKLEAGDLTRKSDALQEKCDSLASQNADLQSELLAARSCTSEAQAEIKKLNEILDDKQKMLSDMQSQRNDERIELERRNEAVMQKLTNSEKSIEELQQGLQKSTLALQERNAELNILKEKIEKQDLQLSDAQRQYENQCAKFEAVVQQNESLTQDLTTLRTSSTDSNAEILKLSQDAVAKQKAYEELLDRSSSERSALESQQQASQQHIDALCKQVEALTEELKTISAESFARFELLNQEQEKCNKQELELSDFARKMETVTNKRIDLENQHELLQKDLNSIRTATSHSNAEVMRLTEELAKKQKDMQAQGDKFSSDRLKLESQVQELTQKIQAIETERNTLQTELEGVTQAKVAQADEFEHHQAELLAKTKRELEESILRQEYEKKAIIDNFEEQLQIAEQRKSALDDAISGFQTQIKLLQDELFKSQLDFKAKEDEFNQHIETHNAEILQLRASFDQVYHENATNQKSAKQEQTSLLQRIEELIVKLTEKERNLEEASNENAQLRSSQTNSTHECGRLETEVSTLKDAKQLLEEELAHKTKLAEEDKSKIQELHHAIDVLQKLNNDISLANEQLSDALEVLEHEKCETLNIFELFEMESDQNLEKLGQKATSMLQELAKTQAELAANEVSLAETRSLLQNVTNNFENSQSALSEMQNQLIERVAKIAELEQANVELQRALDEQLLLAEQRDELSVQVNEYKKVVDEMDENSTAKTAKLAELQEKYQLLEKGQKEMEQANIALNLANEDLQRKLEQMDLEKTREIVALQGRINELLSMHKQYQHNNGAGDGDVAADTESNNLAHINFLNSIIADMQKKNDTLKAKIETLQAQPTDFTQPHAFELLAKRKPTPRLFCDICDEFDKHETEDCPLQASSSREHSPTPNAEANNNDPGKLKERKLPEPRKYCETCEVFGHEAGECDNDECY